MIQITYTHRHGVAEMENQTIAIDAEKIVAVRDRNVFAEIEYGETYGRRRQPIKYQLTTTRAAILAAIAGDYSTLLVNPYLSLTVYDNVIDGHTDGTTYDFDLQEKYIVDIRESFITVNGTLTACRRVEYVPGSFVPEVVYVTDTLASLVDSTPTPYTSTTSTSSTSTSSTSSTSTTTEEEPL